MNKCQKCGTEFDDNFCPNCGSPAQSANPSQPQNAESQSVGWNQVSNQPEQPVQPEAPKKKKKGCLIAVCIVAALVLFGAIGSCAAGGDGDEKTSSADVSSAVSSESPTSSADESSEASSEAVSSEAESSAPSEPSVPSYSAGMHKVGTDIPAGEYVITSYTQMYVEVASDSTGDFDSIIMNENISGRYYVSVSDGQYLTFTSGTATPADQTVAYSPVGGVYEEGMYKVGKDIPAGEYKVHPTEGMGYYEVDSGLGGGSLDNIVSNENFETDVYVTVSDGQYLKLVRSTLTVQ